MIFGFKTKPARQFNYNPRYFDREQEAREARRKAILGENGGDQYQPGSMIREGRLRRMQSSHRMQKGSKVTLTRTAIFVVLTIAVLYIMTSLFERF